MNKKHLHIALLLACLTACFFSEAQVKNTNGFVPLNSATRNAPVSPDSARIDSVMRSHSPRTAAIRSAILPGLGQVYNKKYWKLPIIYGALGVSGAVFIYNLKNYRDLRFAYKARIEATPTSLNPTPDSTDYFKASPLLRDIDPNALQSYRNEFRRNIDYSAVVFVLLWGLNVVDATVDAHLKGFDISPDLSLRLRFGHSEMAGTNGMSLVLAFK